MLASRHINNLDKYVLLFLVKKWTGMTAVICICWKKKTFTQFHLYEKRITHE